MPGETTLLLRVTRAYAPELRACVQAEGLQVTISGEFCAGNLIEVLAVGVGSGGALGSLVTGTFTFLKHRKVTFFPDGSVQSVQGYSKNDLMEIVEIANQQRLDRESEFNGG